jgi:hypothetical protein
MGMMPRRLSTLSIAKDSLNILKPSYTYDQSNPSTVKVKRSTRKARVALAFPCRSLLFPINFTLSVSKNRIGLSENRNRVSKNRIGLSENRNRVSKNRIGLSENRNRLSKNRVRNSSFRVQSCEFSEMGLLSKYSLAECPGLTFPNDKARREYSAS